MIILFHKNLPPSSLLLQDSIFQGSPPHCQKPNGLREAEGFEERRCPTKSWYPPDCCADYYFYFIAFKSLFKNLSEALSEEQANESVNLSIKKTKGYGRRKPLVTAQRGIKQQVWLGWSGLRVLCRPILENTHRQEMGQRLLSGEGLREYTVWLIRHESYFF